MKKNFKGRRFYYLTLSLAILAFGMQLFAYFSKSRLEILSWLGQILAAVALLLLFIRKSLNRSGKHNKSCN